MEYHESLANIIHLTMIPGIGSIRVRHLMQAFGSVEELFHTDASVLLAAGSIGQRVIDGRHDARLRERALREVEFITKNHIQTAVYGEENYPKRLLECPDAPSLLYSLGTINLDSPHILSIVGTRQCTQYGRDLVHRFVAELKQILPDVILVSGLALGIDVESHKAALEQQIPTVGVVAHGLDRIYPYQHREIARQMVKLGGGLLTEYPSCTQPERGNFLARNRIIAGLADATLVAESKDHGGSLVTASIALDYGRDVFAFPGRASDDRSKGCNRLIRLNRAALVTSAAEFVETMGWTVANAKPTAAVQQTLHFEEDNLSPIGHQLLDILRDRGDLRLTQLCDILPNIERAVLQEELLTLEMNNLIRVTPGGLYQLR